jgi:hypothetical protein
MYISNGGKSSPDGGGFPSYFVSRRRFMDKSCEYQNMYRLMK